MEHGTTHAIEAQNESFAVSSVYNSPEAVKDVLKRYNSANCTEFVVTTNNKKSLLIKCSHGIARKSSSTGQRPHQHYNYIGCNAFINLYKSQKDGTLKVTKLDLQHNHELRQPTPASLTAEEEQVVINLRNANAKTSQIKRVLHQTYQKHFTTQKLKNMIKKLVRPGAINEESFETFLHRLDEEGGKIDYAVDAAGEITTFYIASKTMIESFSSSDPPLIQVDLSFDVDKARYKIAAFCYLNPTTNKSEMASIAYTADETAITLDFVFQNFSDLCTSSEKIFIVDKDFTQIESIMRSFPGCSVILCQFHTLKYMRNLLATAVVKVERKTELYSQFKKLVYSHSEEVFDTENENFIKASKSPEVLVRINQNYQPLHSYYTKNWESCKNMWAKCFRKHLPILGDNTTNRVERTFWSLKDSLIETFRGLPDTATSIMHVVNLADRRLQERYNYSSGKSLRIYDGNQHIQSLNDEASQHLNDRGCTIFHTAQKILEKYRSNLCIDPSGVVQEFSQNARKIYSTTSLSCDCSFHHTHQAPCLHILFLREQDNEGFSKDLFSIRYLRNINLPELEFPTPDQAVQETEIDLVSDLMDLEEDPEEIIDALDAREKYKIVNPILLRLGTLISAHSSRQFLKYVDELESIERIIRQGQSVFENRDKTTTEHEKENTSATIDIASSAGSSNPVPPIGSVLPSTSNSVPSFCTQVASSYVPLCSASISVSSGTGTVLPSTVQSGIELQVTPCLSDAPVVDNGAAISTETQTGRFSSITFKKGVVTKGRPKKRGRQVSFRKTQLDQSSKPKKSKRGQRLKKSRAPDFNLLLANVAAEDNTASSQLNLPVTPVLPVHNVQNETSIANHGLLNEPRAVYPTNGSGDGSHFSFSNSLGNNDSLPAPNGPDQTTIPNDGLLHEPGAVYATNRSGYGSHFSFLGHLNNDSLI